MAQTSEPTLLLGEPDREFRDAESAVAGRSPWQIFWRRFRKDRWAVFGLVLTGIIIFLATLGPPLAELATGHTYDEKFQYEMTDEFGQAQGPTLSNEAGFFIFGADDLGRDQLVRMLYGLRTSLIIAFMATGMELFVAISLGLIAGFYRGKVDTFISRVGDIVLTLPILLLALGIAAACGANKEGCFFGLIKPGMFLIAVIIGLFSWPYLARIIRGQALSLREKEFVEAARASGATNRRIIFREVFPNVLAPIIVYTTLIIPTNILFEAVLAFLGIGVPSTIPSLGRMLDEASASFVAKWWMMLFPGLLLLFTTLGFNLMGDGARDALDPKSGRAQES